MTMSKKLSEEEEAAVEQTRRFMVHYKSGELRGSYAAASARGHALVSQGAGCFRCVRCNESGLVGFRDEAFRKECKP